MILYVIGLLCYAVIAVTAVCLYKRARRYRMNWEESDRLACERYGRITVLEKKLSIAQKELDEYKSNDEARKASKNVRNGVCNVKDFRDVLICMLGELAESQGGEPCKRVSAEYDGKFGADYYNVNIEF